MPTPPPRKAERLDNGIPDGAIVCMHVFIVFIGTGLLVMVGWGIWALFKRRTRKGMEGTQSDGGGARPAQTEGRTEKRAQVTNVSERAWRGDQNGAVGVRMDVLRKKREVRRSRGSVGVCSTVPEVRVEEV